MGFTEAILPYFRSSGSHASLFRAMCLDITHDLDIDRASVWVAEGISRDLVLQAGFDRRDCSFDAGTTLPSAMHPLYFAELLVQEFIQVDEALADMRVASMRASYLVPEGVVALLDHIVAGPGGRAVVLCCEQAATGHRPWRDKDRQYLVAMTRLLDQALRESWKSGA